MNWETFDMVDECTCKYCHVRNCQETAMQETTVMIILDHISVILGGNFDA
jgi:hypothetical protein